MAHTDRNANAIVDGVIWKQLLKFFFPIMLGTLFQQLYNTVDTMVVGQFVSKEALAAVGGSAAQIQNFIIGFFVGLSSGATVIVSQFYGADQRDGVYAAVHTAMALAIICGLIMMVLGLIFAPALLVMMNTPADTMEQATIYLRLVFLCMIPGMIFNVGSGILRAVGDSRRPLYFLIICCIVNVVLDLLFVLAFKMGVAGVAIATTLAQTVSAVLVCLSLNKTNDCYRLNFRHIRANPALLKRTIHIGIPAGLQSVMFSVSNMIITTSINSFGTATVAAWVALGKLDALCWMVIGAFGVSAMTFVGQNYGAKRYDRVSRCIWVCIGIGIAATLAFYGLFMLIGRGAFRLFVQEVEIIDIAFMMLAFMAPCYWLYIPVEIISGAMRGMGNTLVPTIISAIGICGLRAAWMFLAVPRWHDITTIMLSYPISWIITSTVFIVYYIKARKKLFAA